MVDLPWKPNFSNLADADDLLQKIDNVNPFILLELSDLGKYHLIPANKNPILMCIINMDVFQDPDTYDLGEITVWLQ